MHWVLAPLAAAGRGRARLQLGLGLASAVLSCLLIGASAHARNDPFVADADTIALYHFDSGALPGDELRDASGHALDLSVSGGVEFVSDNLSWMSSPSGTVARFAAFSDSLGVQIPDELLMPNDAGAITPFSIEARIYPRRYVGEGLGDSLIVGLVQAYNAQLSFHESMWPGIAEPTLSGRNAGDTDYVDVLTQRDCARELTPEEWHLLQIRVDASGWVQALIDERVVGEGAMFFYPGYAGAWTLTLGHFDGDLDEVRISRGVQASASPAPLARFVQTAYEVTEGATLPLALEVDGSSPAIEWRVESGPAVVEFTSPSLSSSDGSAIAHVQAGFSTAGKYVISGEVSDQAASSRDYAVVNVRALSASSASKRVLFTGHSLVYTGPIPALVQAMAARSGDADSVVAMYAYPDRRISGFWYLPHDDPDPNVTDFPDVPYLRTLVVTQDWDVVILTLYPRWTLSVDAAQEAQDDALYAGLFARYFRKHGARTLLFSVAQSSPLAAQQIARANHATVIPTGVVWDQLQAAGFHDLFNLFDYPHPQGQGIFLNAYTAYVSLFGRHPDGPYNGQQAGFTGVVARATEDVIAQDLDLYVDGHALP